MVFLKDVKASDMECFLQFIYLGEVTVPADNLDELIKVARALGIRGDCIGLVCATFNLPSQSRSGRSHSRFERF